MCPFLTFSPKDDSLGVLKSIATTCVRMCVCECVCRVSDSLIVGGETVGEAGEGRPLRRRGGGRIRGNIPGPSQILRKISGGVGREGRLCRPLVCPYKSKGGALNFPDLANFRKNSCVPPAPLRFETAT